MKRSTVWTALLVTGVLLSVPGLGHAQDVNGILTAIANGFGPEMNKGNLDGLAAGYAPDAVRIHPLAGKIEGRDGQKGFLKFLYDNYSDQKLSEGKRVVSGNMAAVEWIWEATHKESGKPVRIEEFVILEFDRSGQIKWQRQYFDSAAFLKQLE